MNTEHAFVDSVLAILGSQRAQARRAQAAGRHFKALQHWTRLAVRNHPDAQFQVGRLYENGLGVVRDPIEAATWYRQAAEHGYAPAQLNLGRILINGAHAAVPPNFRSGAVAEDVALLFPKGIELAADPREAIEMLRAAAEKGHSEAYAVLGALFFEGRKVAQDYVEAKRWYELGAEKGNASAQFGLGDILFNGLGVSSDPVLAADWYEKAAIQGHVRAQTAMGYIHEVGRGRRPDPELAGAWYIRAAEKGEAFALHAAGRMHLSGIGLPRNVDRAETYWRQAAKVGHTPSMIALSELYERGAEVTADPREAVRWRQAAAKNGHTDSKFLAAQMLASGAAGGVNINEIATLFASAADAGHSLAAFNLGALIASSTANSRADALPWYLKAAERGVPEAAGRLADLYLDETLPIYDRSLGLHWLSKAAKTDEGASERYALLLIAHSDQAEVLEQAEALLLKVAGPKRPEACFALAELYARRLQRRLEPEKATRYYAIAAQAGHKEARYVMATALVERSGDPTQIAAGAATLRELAEDGHPAAQFQFGVLLCRGVGMAPNLSAAIDWYRKSAASGYALAEYNLGVMLLEGLGTTPQVAEGRRLIALAVEKGIVPKRGKQT